MVAEKAYESTMLIMDKLQKNPAVRMRNPAAVQAKIQTIIRDGYEKLLVCCSF